MARSKSSADWLKEHVDDIWVQKAQQDGYRTRASYKLIELDDKDKLIRPGSVVVDLGSAPGGWSQVVAQRVGEKGLVIASDILEIPQDRLIVLSAGKAARQSKCLMGQTTIPESHPIHADLIPGCCRIY